VARSLLERFLYRVSIHPLGHQDFVLKGGLLLAQFGARRVTRDIHILGRAFPGDEQEIIRRVTQISATAITTASPSNLTQARALPARITNSADRRYPT
jgi:hypothetical protein